MNAVIYARYSSHNQTEQSIEGQLTACYNYAKANNLVVIAEYIDRAKSGTNDNRPHFQKMLRDSAKRQFEIVLVYQLDRFARNRYDSATCKAKLKKNDVKIVSVRENISDDAAGVLMESVLEGMAEYYSAELSQKVMRGLAISVGKCRHIGGKLPLGYTTNTEKKYVIDPATAPIVKKCFEMYVSGSTLKEINKTITEAYGKAYFGNTFNSLNRLLSSKEYIGYYTRRGQDVKDGVPRIVDDEMFERAQHRLSKNKKAPARARAHEEYLLTTKLFCGYDKEMMVGTSGTSKTGKIYHYYTCKSVWRKTGCKKKNVGKAIIEDFVISKAYEQLTDENIAQIAKIVSDISRRDGNGQTIAALKLQLKEMDKAISNLLDAIEQGEHMDLLSERITQKRADKGEIEKALAHELMDKCEIDETEIAFFLTALKNGNIEDINHRRAIITIFVDAIFLYDDHATIVFNASGKPVSTNYAFVDKIEESNANTIGKECSYMTQHAP